MYKAGAQMAPRIFYVAFKLGFMEQFGRVLAPRTCEGGGSPNGLTGGVKIVLSPNSPSQIA